jgi:hypothetical protein
MNAEDEQISIFGRMRLAISCLDMLDRIDAMAAQDNTIVVEQRAPLEVG